MKIGFIGAGKAGFSLGKYFVSGGLEVTGYYSRNLESARAAGVFTNTICFETLETIILANDILFLTVPDEAIEEVWAQMKHYSLTSKVICHCSGAMSSAVFSEIGQKGAFGYSVHPLLAIRSKEESYQELSQAFFTIEGSTEYLDELLSMFRLLGNSVQVIAAEQKAKYHAGAVVVSNQVAALFHIGSRLLFECGFDKEASEQVLLPLFLNNCRGIAQDGVIKSLTGPVERNDAATVKKHLACLEGEDKLLYRLLSKELVKIAEEKHEDRDYNALIQLLEEVER